MNRLGLALVALLLLAAGYWYWQDSRQAVRRAQLAESEASGRGTPSPEGSAARPLYRWRDAQGVLQVSDTPPKDQPYEKVEIRDDQNVVPMTGQAPEPSN